MKKRWIVLLLILIGIAIGAVVKWKRPATKTDAPGAVVKQVPAVNVEKVRKENVPVWLSGIGTAQASNTVVVRPRVSGALEKVLFSEGAVVKEGDVIAQIDPRPYESILAQAVAKKAQNEAQLANARLDAERFANLLKANAVSQQQADLSAASVAQLEAQVKADDAAIDAAELDLEFTKVRAPISGRTGVRLVDTGNLLTANQEAGIVVITEIRPIFVVFTLPQQNLATLASVTKQDAEKLKVQALGQEEQVLDEGELELIDNQIDTATGTIKLKAKFTNENLALWPGLYVSARVRVNTLTDALVVSPESVQPGLDGPFCYVLKEDHTVEARRVEIALRVENGAVIQKGLQAGETVVLNGQSKLRPGSKVVPQEIKKVP